ARHRPRNPRRDRHSHRSRGPRRARIHLLGPAHTTATRCRAACVPGSAADRRRPARGGCVAGAVTRTGRDDHPVVTRPLHIAGSARLDADSDLLADAHALAANVVGGWLARGGSVVAGIGGEPAHASRPELSVIFDWT